MKKSVKIVCGITGAIVAVGIVGSMMNGNSDVEKQSVSNPKTEQTQSKSEQIKKTENKPKETTEYDNISQESFDKIKTGDTLTGDGGMNREKVISILGNPSTDITSTSNISGKEYEMETITWMTTAGLELKSITVIFTNGNASSKSILQ